MNNEFRRIQKLAGVKVNEIRINKPGERLNREDLDILKDSILSVYTDWLDLDDHADGDMVWDTEYHRWRYLDDFILSMLYRGINPTYLKKLKNKLGEKDLDDYIEKYHQDWLDEVAKAIREDIPSYFEDEDEDEDE